MAFRLLFAFILSTALAACVSVRPAPTANPMNQSSAVSVAMPGFITSTNTVLRWHSDLIWIDDPEGRYERRAVMLQQALQDEFKRKGYSFVGPDEEANYDVLAVALLGEIQGHAEVEEIFRMYPSLNAPSEGYKRGTILVALAAAGTDTVVWRGALEIFTDPGMQQIQLRQQRMQWGAKQVLSSIPNY